MKLAACLPLSVLNPRLKISRFLTLFSYFGLLAWLALGLIWFPPPEGARWWVILSVLWLPLLFFLPIIINKSPKGHAWLCFVTLVYFLQGSTTFIQPGKAMLGLVEACLALLLFSAAMMYGRWQAIYLRYYSAAHADSSSIDTETPVHSAGSTSDSSQQI